MSPQRNRTKKTEPTRDYGRPISSLHPTAQSILRAAYEILEKQGLSELTFDGIAKASGHYKGSITYFFGNKANLVTALADLLSHDIVAESLGAGHRASVPERVHEVVSMNARVSRNIAYLRPFFEIAAQAMRADDLRQRMAKLYDDYRELERRMIDPDAAPDVAEEVDKLAVLTLAINDGLSLQHALDPDGFDSEPYWRYWEELATARLAMNTHQPPP